MESVYAFLDSLKRAEKAVLPCNVKQPTRRAIFDIEQEADVLLRAIRATYKRIGINVAPRPRPVAVATSHRYGSPQWTPHVKHTAVGSS
jgi:hypothetical protein